MRRWVVIYGEKVLYIDGRWIYPILLFLLLIFVLSLKLGINLITGGEINVREQKLFERRREAAERLVNLQERVTRIGEQLSQLEDFLYKFGVVWNILPEPFPEPVSTESGDNLFEHNITWLEKRQAWLESQLKKIESGIEEKEYLFAHIPSIWPAPGYITSGYGWRRDPFTHRREFHPAIDISNVEGTPVVATADGIVHFTGWVRGYGKTIIIDHGFGYSTLYGHLKKMLVKEGQVVRRGEVIGLMGHTGRTTGTHLHYEVRYFNRHKNPMDYVLDEGVAY
ncbi:hypothetical protein CGW93_01540 [candidate division bacterium WOR-3 4484_18]|uniref:M23ase beta-sheet core domain-containing protein n=1 Tax=candidate division WOR-3 bacterium 4484_18 TaxID=2020626 RepID=A0A257LWJ1_UNCW3|nr:MAG: hypothetical protein CGW93_01540 [candidate division bacterium WOR-3 4484_18]